MARARTTAPVWPEDRPELLPFLPMVYAAWVDGVMSAQELATIRDRAAAQDWLDAGARDALATWLEPARPPAAAALVGLRERLRALVKTANEGTRRSLVELGLALASAEAGNGAWTQPEAQRALNELESDLRIVSAEAVRQILAETVPTPRGTDPPRPPVPAGIHDIRELLMRPHAAVRREVLALLEDDTFVLPIDLPRAEYRERVLSAARALAARGLGALAFPRAAGGAADPGAALAAFETLALGDSSVLIKFGVQFGLFGGSILNLGTERHHRGYLPDVASLALPGCYAMTESGHGSNVRDLETVARFDLESGDFVVHTPHGPGPEGLDRQRPVARSHGHGLRPSDGGRRGPRRARAARADTRPQRRAAARRRD